jgi:fascin 1/2
MADGEGSPFNPKLLWKIALIANNNKYLTTEKIGNLVHPTGNDMRKNQIWLLDPFPEYVHLKAPNGKYLTAGQKGQLVTEKKDSPGTDEQWTITALDDGRWTIKSAYGYFLSMDENKPEDHLNSFSRSGDNEKSKFTVQLAIHPQVVMRNNKRNSYCHLEGDMLAVTEKIPWGVDAVLTLGYHGGKYSIASSNGKYVNAAGAFVDSVGEDSKYILVVMNDQVAFKSNKGKYLQTSGGSGKLHAKQNEITENELFVFEDSHPQVTLRSFSSQKHLVTWKQGDDVKAIHEQAATDKEIFQFEIDRAADGNPSKPARWSLRNSDGGYLTLNEGSLFTKPDQARNDESWFEMTWLGDCCAFKAGNGKYLRRDPHGGLVAKGDDLADNCKFFFNLDNRPQIVLRGEFGFLAVKSVQGKDLVTCNNPIGDVFVMTCNNGNYTLQAPSNGKFLKLESDGNISASDASASESFHLSLIVHSKLAIKAAATGKYLKGEQNGGFKASSNSIGANELWEF